MGGMENIRNFYGGYGDMPPWGKGPVQGKVYSGPSYIEDNFPLTSRFKTCTVERGDDGGRGDDGKSKNIGGKFSVRGAKFKRALKSGVDKLKTKIDESDTSTELIVVSGILVIVLLLFAFKISRGKKKG